MSHTKQYKAPALEKGLDILELLSEQEDGLTQKDIADLLERKPSEIFRMIVILEERGYIDLVPGTDRYQLTLKLFHIGNRQSPVKRLNELAVPVMNQLARKIRQSCQVAIYNSGQVVVVAQVDSSHKYNLSVKPGTKLDLLESASGIVLLAWSSPHQREGIARACGVELTDYLVARLDEIATSDVYERASRVLKGVVNFGCPIVNHQGEVVASLTVPYINKGENAGSKKDVRKHTQEAAMHISELLGYQFD